MVDEKQEEMKDCAVYTVRELLAKCPQRILDEQVIGLTIVKVLKPEEVDVLDEDGKPIGKAAKLSFKGDHIGLTPYMAAKIQMAAGIQAQQQLAAMSNDELAMHGAADNQGVN